MWQTGRFLADENGAVATDWVVLTAGLVGLGVATIIVVSAGVENQSNDIANWLANASFFRNAMTVVGSFDFSGGDMAGWVGGQVMDMGGQLGEKAAGCSSRQADDNDGGSVREPNCATNDLRPWSEAIASTQRANARATISGNDDDQRRSRSPSQPTWQSNHA